MAADSSLALHSFEVGYAQDRPLLASLDLSLNAGEIIALHGPSGCGKTTLLRSIAGLLDPVRGRITLQGRTPSQWGWPQYRRQILFVDQQPVLLEGPVRESLKRPFQYRSSAPLAYNEARVKAWFERLELPLSLLDQPAGVLSVGQQQRVCLIRALLLQPCVLLLDEPTSALDASAAGLVEQGVRRECQDRGLAVLVATHQTERALGWCNRQIPLHPFPPSMA